MTRFQTARALALLTPLIALMGCAPQLGTGFQQDYLEGHRALQNGDYARAIAQLQKISEHAAEPYASQAHLELLYAYYKQGDFAAARRSADRFLQNHAQHPRADYAQYLLASAGLQAALAADDSNLERRDQALTSAYDAFLTLSRDFPESDFNEKALLSLAFIRQQLAQAHLIQAMDELHHADEDTALTRLDTISTAYRGTPAAQQAEALLELPASARLDAVRPPHQAETAPMLTPAPTARSQDRAPAVSAPVVIEDAQWLLRQAPDRYTLELLSASPDRLTIFVTRHRLHGAAAYPAKPGSDAKQILVHGLYPSAESAKLAAKQLGKRWNTSTPRIRRIGELQALLSQTEAFKAAKR